VEEALAAALAAPDCRHLLVVTGAGVSAASGIRTFRGSEPDAIWKQSDVELATAATFRRDPLRQWRWYLERFASVDRAEPNPAHFALADLERWHEARGGRFLLVTQNIDTLHARAGSRRLIEVHGTAARLRCSRWGCAHGSPAGSLPRAAVDLGPLAREAVAEALPRCPACGSLLRAHVLFFDEFYDDHRDFRFAEVSAAAEQADLLLFVGTSFAVGVTDMLLRAALRRRARMFSVDPGTLRAPCPEVTLLREPAEELLPRLLRRLPPSTAPGA
jgi:NAD-dependent deacetylase